jgi:hypothetical protein
VARISFQKRQKEMKRQEKQKMKAEKRAQRKLAKSSGTAPEGQESEEITLDGIAEDAALITAPEPTIE